ncbi:Hypothetical protein I596_13 [Dokdonella koreensis DS-123]|uniref:Uncharacterized protein n=1 Tax=Dokdonella koreensis DS-123 TaxID=1300342 RepID=A0A167G1J4_9GAMM|nr:Hypothetical protein I596_13 [Dokdonella koreensis DS-123]
MTETVPQHTAQGCDFRTMARAAPARIVDRCRHVLVCCLCRSCCSAPAPRRRGANVRLRR